MSVARAQSRQDGLAREASRLVNWAIAAAVTIAVGIALAQVGAPPGPPPAWPSPSDIVNAFTASQPPLEATRYVVSMAGWAIVAYLGVILTGRGLVEIASIRREWTWVGTLDRAVSKATVPPLRRFLEGSLAGVVLMTSAMRLTPAAAESPTPAPGREVTVSESMIMLDRVLEAGDLIAQQSEAMNRQWLSSPMAQWVRQHLGEGYLYVDPFNPDDPRAYWALNPGGTHNLFQIAVSHPDAPVPPPPPPGVDPVAWLNGIYFLTFGNFGQQLVDDLREQQAQMEAARAAGRLLGGPMPGQPVDPYGFPIVGDPEVVHVEIMVVPHPYYGESPGIRFLLDLFREWGARIETRSGPMGTSSRYFVVDIPREVYNRFLVTGDIGQLLQEAPGFSQVTGSGTAATAQEQGDSIGVTAPIARTTGTGAPAQAGSSDLVRSSPASTGRERLRGDLRQTVQAPVVRPSGSVAGQAVLGSSEGRSAGVSESMIALDRILEAGDEIARWSQEINEQWMQSPQAQWVREHLGDRYLYVDPFSPDDAREYWALNPWYSNLWWSAVNDPDAPVPPPPPPGVDPVAWLNAVYGITMGDFGPGLVQRLQETQRRIEEARRTGKLLGGPMPGQPVDPYGLPIVGDPTVVHVEVPVPTHPQYGISPGAALLENLFREWGGRIANIGGSPHFVVDIPRDVWNRFILSGDVDTLLREAPGFGRIAGGTGAAAALAVQPTDSGQHGSPTGPGGHLAQSGQSNPAAVADASHGQQVRRVAESAPPGPRHGETVAQAAQTNGGRRTQQPVGASVAAASPSSVQGTGSTSGQAAPQQGPRVFDFSIPEGTSPALTPASQPFHAPGGDLLTNPLVYLRSLTHGFSLHNPPVFSLEPNAPVQIRVMTGIESGRLAMEMLEDAGYAERQGDGSWIITIPRETWLAVGGDLSQLVSSGE